MDFSTIAFSKGFFYLPFKTFEQHVKNIIDTDLSINGIRNIKPEVISIQAEVMRYGYMFDSKSIYMMNFCLDKSDIENYCSSLAEYLKNTYGDGEFHSLFGNFPATVLDMNDYEFYLKQICHYLSGGVYPYDYNIGQEEYSKYSQNLCDSYKVITLIDTKSFCDICKDICSAQQSLTLYDKEIVLYFCNNYEKLPAADTSYFIPNDVPFKETACMLITNGLCVPKTVTDVLRAAVYMSGGDISLADPCKFKKFSRSERRFILSMLDKVANTSNMDDYAEMKQHYNSWIRLGEILHPGEFIKYPNAMRAFMMLRNNAKYIKTFESDLFRAYKANDLDSMLFLLKKQPGKFARNLDWIIRTRKNLIDAMKVVNAFTSVIDKVSIKVIYELIEYYNKRNEPFFLDNRNVFTKGARKPTKIKSLQPIDADVRRALLNDLTTTLMNYFTKTKDSLKDKIVVLDKNLTNIMLPTNMRSMNIAPGQQTRGTKIPLKADKDVLRLYVHWQDPHGNFDLDLSTVGYSADFERIFTMSWNTDRLYKNQDVIGIFSGDVRHKVGNCAEYMDISIKKAKSNKIRYIVGCVSDYDCSGFTNMNAWAGVMFRDEFGTPGEKTWAPDTVANGFKIMNPKANNIIMTIIDLEEMCMYVVDEDFGGTPVISQFTDDIIKEAKFIERIKYVVFPKYFNAFKLIQLNARSRFAEVEVHSHEEILKLKEQMSKLPEFKSKLSKYNDISPKQAKEYLILKKTIDLLESVIVVDYDDISLDYTKLFKWMF